MKQLPIRRRTFLRAAAAVTAVAAVKARAPAVLAADSSSKILVDVNVNLSRWPLRRVRYDDTAALVAMLRSHGVSQAWTSSFDALLHKDIAAVNARLVDDCRRHGRGLLVPFAAINPKSPDWEEELRRCSEEYRIPGIRLHPNYHGYKLDDPDFARLLRLAAQRGLVVQITALMEDERMMHPLLHVDPVDLAPLAAIVSQSPGLRLVVLNAMGKLKPQTLAALLAAGDVYVEIAMLEGVAAITSLLDQIPENRVLFGSHAPLFYFQSALFKLKESDLSPKQQHAIRSGNAQLLHAKFP